MKSLGKSILTICLTAMTCFSVLLACQIQVIDHVHISCYGLTDGRIKVSTTNCKGQVSYKWSNGAVTPEITNLSAGTYTLVVSDESGATDVETFTINEPQKLELDLSFIEPLCHGESTASVYSSPYGGTWPYTFKWSNGSTNGHLHDVPAGTYGLTITDDNGCTASKSILVTEPDPIKITADYLFDVTCFGAKNGSVRVTPSKGTPPYTYSWSSGHTTALANNLGPGTVTVTVTDYFSCSSTASYTIQEPSALKITDVAHENISCNGAKDGLIEVKVSGGTPSYAYKWSNGGTTAKIQNLSPGTYSVEVTDGNKCIASKSYTITQPSPLKVNTLGVTHNDCFGDKNGIISVEGDGGTAPYAYDWSNGAKTSKISQLAAGTYMVTISDDNNCTISESFSITEPTPMSLQVLQETHVNCFGGNDGLIEVKVSGGTPSYTYNWSNGKTSSKIEDLKAGTYWVEVLDDNNCILRDTFEILQPQELILNLLSHIDVSCFGEKDGSLTVGAMGGVVPYTYKWSTGATTATISDLGIGTYTATITDKNNCTVTESFTIVQPNGLSMTVQSFADVSCFGAKDGFIEVKASGGTSPYTYNWDHGPTGAIVNNLAIGQYTVVVTDKNGCKEELTYSILQPEALDLKLNNIVHNSCGETMNGEIHLSTSGGTAPYQYQWNHGPTTSSLSQLPKGIYIVQVTDDHKCTSRDTFEIFRSDSLVPAVELVENIRCHDEKNGSITLQMSGGTPPYQYEWSNGSTNAKISNLSEGIYSCLVTDDNDCAYYATYEVKNPAPINVEILDFDHLECGKDSSGQIAINFSGGTGTTSIEWVYQPTPSDSFRQIKVTYGQTDTLDHLPSGLYLYTITDENACFIHDTVMLFNAGGIQIEHEDISTVSCYGDSNGSIGVEFEGGQNIFFVEWTYRPIGGKTFEPLVTSYNVKGDTIDNLLAGTYRAYVEDTSGCSLIDSFEIDQPEAIRNDQVSVEDPKCFNTEDGQIEIQIKGGSSPFAVEWTYRPVGGKTFEPLVTSYNVIGDTLDNLSAGTYAVVMRDDAKCEGFDTIEVNQPAPIERQSHSISSPSCFDSNNGKIEFEYSGPSGIDFVEWTYSPVIDGKFDFVEWTYSNPGALEDTKKGFYIGKVMDENQCSLIDTFEVTGPDEIEIQTLVIDDPLCHNEENGQIEIEFTGGSTANYVEWTYSPKEAGTYTKVNTTFGQKKDILINAKSGFYKVVFEDKNGCQLTDTLFVDQPELIQANIIDIKPSSGSNGVIEIEIEGGVDPYSPTWTGPNGFTSYDEDLYNLEAGRYDLEVIDDNKCVFHLDSVIVPGITSSSDWHSTEVKVFPMPFSNNLNIDLENHSGIEHSIILMNNLGQVVDYQITHDAQIQMNIDHNLPVGEYLLRIEKQSEVLIKKIIKQ